jgi:hypothetical protein
MTDRGQDHTDADGDRSRARPRLKDVSHTNPYTGESFGETTTYQRGPTVAADGGRDPDREPSDGDGEAEAEADADVEAEDREETLQDVDHEPPDGEGTQATYERGNEGRDAVR